MNQIKNAAIRWASRKGYGDQSDDFTSFVLLKIVKTKPDRLYLSNWFVDFKRELYGDSRRTKVHREEFRECEKCGKAFHESEMT